MKPWKKKSPMMLPLTSKLWLKNGEEIAAAATVIESVTDRALWFNEMVEEKELRLRFELNNAKLYSFKLKQ